jgi:uncharacterized membrane protein
VGLSSLVQWIHILAAVTAVGGVIFLRFVLLPSVQETPDAERQALMERVVGRFRPFLWGSIGVLLATGLYNAGQVAVRGGFAIPGYVGVLVVKVLLAFIIFTIAILLTVPGPAFSGLKARRKGWLMFNTLLGTAIILLSAVLRRM